LAGFLFVAGVAAGTIVSDDGGSKPVAETRGDQPGNDGNGSSGTPDGNSEAGEYSLVVTFIGEGGESVFAGGKPCSEPGCTLEFPSGTTIQFDSSADDGYEFEGFSGDCSGLSCTLTMDSSKSVTATFGKESREGETTTSTLDEVDGSALPEDEESENLEEGPEAAPEGE
jgi:hypothetical protein